jgi:quercetin dioxygenase-like cupin family protein
MSTQKSNNMRELEDLILGKNSAKKTCYSGGTEGSCLYYGPDAAVQRAFLPTGTTLEKHVHEATEILVVLSGVFYAIVDSGKTLIPVAGTAIFPPNTPHGCYSETDAWVIGITVPCDKAYPHD